MNKYTVKSGQNLYDIALTLYGSIEGIFDLLVSNPSISFNTTFSKGMELNYHEDFVVNQDVVNWFDTNSINIKNGECQTKIIDVRSEIINWIDNNNKELFNQYSNSVLTLVKTDDTESIQTYDWDKEDTPTIISDTQDNTTISSIAGSQLIPFTPQNKWDIQNVDIDVSLERKNILQFAETLSKINFGELSQDDLSANLDVLFSNGMITLPTDENDKQLYYDTVSTPKILIKQSGENITIGMQIPSNSFVAINWGDGTTLDFYHYKKNAINATHTYSDTSQHTITIYGDNKFTNLDLTKINGVYYALAEIYISNDFISLYPNETTLNKLFIKKAIQ